MNSSIHLPALGIVNALGNSADEIANRLFHGDTDGLVLEDGWLPGRPARVGRVSSELPEVPSHLSEFSCRNNRLLLAALEQIRPEVEAAVEHFGRERIGVVLGTSTAGIAEGEAAIAAHRANGRLPESFHYVQQELGSPSLFLARVLSIAGPAYGISTACTSSAKVFAAARRLLRSGLCDVVLAGGVDSLCKLTINGFASLESISSDICNPMSRNRNGINIGEGAALFLMTSGQCGSQKGFTLFGVGESSDAHHISAPHPEGAGAEAAMRAALADAGIPPCAVGYLNMHATATLKNDEMESLAISRVFPQGVPASGTKPMTGHMLGAAGATELGLCWLALRENVLPPHVWDGAADPALPRLDLVESRRQFGRNAARICMSNSFAFGGSNVCLIIGDAP